MKNMYIHRKKYPLILAFAITIHKCQGLSLDTAIIDLSQEVFGDGMAYVALSHVRTLSGLHLNVKVHYKTNNYRWLMTYATSSNLIRTIWYKRRCPGHKMADTAVQI